MQYVNDPCSSGSISNDLSCGLHAKKVTMPAVFRASALFSPIDITPFSPPISRQASMNITMLLQPVSLSSLTMSSILIAVFSML